MLLGTNEAASAQKDAGRKRTPSGDTATSQEVTPLWSIKVPMFSWSELYLQSCDAHTGVPVQPPHPSPSSTKLVHVILSDALLNRGGRVPILIELLKIITMKTSSQRIQSRVRNTNEVVIGIVPDNNTSCPSGTAGASLSVWCENVTLISRLLIN